MTLYNSKGSTILTNCGNNRSLELRLSNYYTSSGHTCSTQQSRLVSPTASLPVLAISLGYKHSTDQRKLPVIPGRTREACGVPSLHTREGLTLLSQLCRDRAIGVRNVDETWRSCINSKWGPLPLRHTQWSPELLESLTTVLNQNKHLPSFLICKELEYMFWSVFLEDNCIVLFLEEDGTGLGQSRGRGCWNHWNTGE